MANQPGDNKVKLETVPSLGSIPSTTRRNDFAVLVRVTAPPAGVSTGQRLSLPGGVDLVAVLDVSESMKEENKLQRMKKAMIFVIDKLGLGDRLAVVAFNGEQVQRLTELSLMSDKKNRVDAKSEVKKLIAGGARGGGTNVSAAMEEAAAMLGQRGEVERNNRVGRIIFLSNGDDDDGGATPGKNSSPELVAEAFGLGADHDPNAMIFSKDETSGVYSYSNQDLDRIRDADSIRGLTSADAAIAVQVDLQAHNDGVAISALESGGRRVSVAGGGGGGDDGRQSGLTVYIHDLYAGEQKRFIVYLTVPEGEKEQLLTAGGRYGDPENTTGGYNSRLDDSKVSVLRPDESTPGDETMSPEVAEEFARARLPKGGAVPPATDTESKTTYWWRVLPCVALLLILAALLIGNMPEEEEGNKSGSLLDISQHPGWPKMEKSLDATMLEMIEDIGITYLLHGAQVDDMSRSMNKYIYLALAHASVLGSRYGPAAVSGQDGVSVLEQTVERLEAEEEELRIKFVALAGEKVSVAADDCAASKQEALERANTRIAELERQLQDKKVFADSLLSEVANADAHLKTCGQRADMLEIKVRELEGADADREWVHIV